MTNENTSLNNIKPSLKDEFCVWSQVGNPSVENDINEEYILPDYLPDIRKILLVNSKINSTDVFAQDQKAEVVGEVEFSIVYLGDTGEIKCIKQTYEYNGKSSMESIYEDSIINVRSFIKNRSVRAVSPRKLVIKAKIGSDLTVYNKLCVSPRLVGSEGVEDEFTLERNMNEIDCVNFIKFTENDIRVSEDIDYSGKMPIGEIIWSDIDMCVNECKYADGRMTIKGYAKLMCFFAINSEGEDMQYDLIEKNIPINKTSEVTLPKGEWFISTDLALDAFECAVGNDSYGEPRVLEVDFSATANVLAMSNEKSMFTDDVYSTVYDYSNKYKKVNTERVVKCCNMNFSVSGSGELQEKDVNPKEVVLSCADAQINSMENKAGKAIFSGECNVRTVIKTKEDGYINSEFTFPVKYEMQCGCDEIGKYICKANVLDLKTKLDGDKINANAEIGLDISMFENIAATTVETINIDKSKLLQKSRDKIMILYYPEPNETMWSIAKKYNISPRDLENANNKKLDNGLPRVLVIPV